MATITEDYVSFEIALLLKKKGFDVKCNKVIHQDTKNEYYFGYFGNYTDYIKGRLLLVPTLQMAMKWLREVHKIHIQIWILEEKGYWFDIEKILNAQYKHKSLYSTGLEDIYFESYEKAVKAAIKYCLKNLI